MSRESWNRLAKNNKTTGYSDYSISFFDQIMRLKVVEKIIEQYFTSDTSDSTALDFGCGVGDFTSCFSHRFKYFVSYDISDEALIIAKEKCKNLSNVLLTNSLDEINSLFDVVFSVTVMQHILDDEELLRTLSYISSKCKKGAIFIALESVESNKFNIIQPKWLKARRSEEWAGYFEKAGFEILSIKSFYNPFVIPTPSYVKYRKKVFLFSCIYKLFKQLGFNITLFNPFFKKQAENILEKEENIDGLIKEESFSKIFVAIKKLEEY